MKLSPQSFSPVESSKFGEKVASMPLTEANAAGEGPAGVWPASGACYST